ncbi:MAG: hypothetical protein M5R41_16620 [Bacteroidia bacterium]|nr:hypothetical protein [Bacteroidia bacterium]
MTSKNDMSAQPLNGGLPATSPDVTRRSLYTMVRIEAANMWTFALNRNYPVGLPGRPLIGFTHENGGR